jgi:hypothetical protein
MNETPHVLVAMLIAPPSMFVTLDNGCYVNLLAHRGVQRPPPARALDQRRTSSRAAGALGSPQLSSYTNEICVESVQGSAADFLAECRLCGLAGGRLVGVL